MLIKYKPKIEHLKCVTLSAREGIVLEKTMIKLLPGTNEVTNDEWKAMRPNITAELESGEISILAQKVSAGRGKVGGIKAKDLKEMPVNLAVKYVSECNSPDTLEKWYSEITNEEVRLAIVKKFKKLGLELPEDEIPDTPNGSPMTLAEFDEDENDDSEITDNEDENDEEIQNESESDDTDFNSLKVAELKSLCEEKGIDTKDFTKKADYVNALNEINEE